MTRGRQHTESMYLLPLRSSSQNRMGAEPNLVVSAFRKSSVETVTLLGTMLASFSAPCKACSAASDSHVHDLLSDAEADLLVKACEKSSAETESLLCIMLSKLCCA